MRDNPPTRQSERESGEDEMQHPRPPYRIPPPLWVEANSGDLEDKSKPES